MLHSRHIIYIPLAVSQGISKSAAENVTLCTLSKRHNNPKNLNNYFIIFDSF